MRIVPALLILPLAACSGTSDPLPTSASMDATVIADPCTTATPCALPPDTPQTEFIYPVGDTDRYAFTVPEADRILEITVRNDANFSPVALEVVLFGPDGMALENRRGDQGRQTIRIRRVAFVPGAYEVDIREVGSDNEDATNPYSIELKLFDQEDVNEPNDTAEDATALPLETNVSGNIATQADEDWFRFAVGPNELIRVDMSSSCERAGSPVELEWTLVRAADGQPIASVREPAVCPESTAGTPIPDWPVDVRAVGNTGGDYLIQVRDAPGDDPAADADHPYTLRVQTVPEPDVQDRAAPNETPQTATVIASGQRVSGFIAGIADVDYYAIDVSGASIDNPYLLVVDADMAGPSEVDLSFLVLDRDAMTQVCRARDGDRCEALRFTLDGREEAARLSTSHPVFVDGTYYILVRDQQDNDADQTVAYSLTARLLRDPDANENFSFAERNAAVIVPTVTPTSGQTLRFAEVRGLISHANDEDWFRFDIPDGIEPSVGQNGDWLVEVSLRINAPTPVELEAFFFGPAGSARQSYGGYGRRCRRFDPNVVDPEPCQFPDAENGINETFGEANGDCFVVFREVTESGPHYFRMSDLDRDDHDLTNEYALQVTVTAGCPEESVCIGRFEGPDGDLCGRP